MNEPDEHWQEAYDNDGDRDFDDGFEDYELEVNDD